MKRNRTLFFSIEIILGICFFVCAIMLVAGDRFSHKPRIYALIQDSDGAGQSRLVYGMRSAAADNNAELVVIGTSYMDDVALQESIIKSEIISDADAIIVEPAPGEEAGAILADLAGKVPTTLIKTDVLKGDLGKPVIKVDTEVLGDSLLEEALKESDFHHIYTVSKGLDTKSLMDLNEYIDSALKSQNMELKDTLNSKDLDAFPVFRDRAILIVLDNDSLVAVGDYFSDREKRPLIVGVGHSEEAFYFLEKGIVKGLVVPQEYKLGYTGVLSALNSTKRIKKPMEDFSIGCVVLSSENMFSEDYQQILYLSGRSSLLR